MTALAVAALVFGMGMAGLIAFNNFYRYALSEQSVRVDSTLASYEDSLSRLISTHRSALLYTADSDNFSNVAKDPESLARSLGPMFTHLMDSFGDVGAVVYADRTGRYFGSGGVSTAPQGFDARNSEWYSLGASLEDGQVQLTGLYRDPASGEWAASLVTPVSDAEGSFLGVLSAELDLASLAALNESYRIGENGFTFATKDGRYFIHRDTSLLGLPVAREMMRDAEVTGTSDTLRYSEGGRRYLVQSNYVSSLDLTLWATADEQELLAPFMDSVVQITISTFLIVFAALVLIRLVMIKMSQEIGDLVRVSHDMSHGKFDARAKTQTSREFTELASSLNAMAGTIEVRTRDLEGSLRKVQDSYHEIVTMLSMALEANDDTTQGHCARVELYSMRMGQAIGLPLSRLSALNDAALLHDVGKIGVPSWVLNKEGPLDAAEIDLMRRHPEIGRRILMGSAGMSDVAEIVYEHHEWFDGAGYPRGLAGDDILVEARILCIVDTFDAMTCSRPYRKQPLTSTQAVARLRAGAGTQFDPELVELFIGILEENPINCGSPDEPREGGAE